MKTNPVSIKILLICLSILFAGISLSAQEDQKNITLKLYTNFSSYRLEETGSSQSNNNSYLYRNKEIQMGYFSPAIVFSSRKGNFQELELSRLQINRAEKETVLIYDGTDTVNQMVEGDLATNILISFRYEYNILLLKKNNEAKLKPYIGFAANTYYAGKYIKPKVSLSYPFAQTRLGISFAVVPRLVYHFNERWSLDLNVPVSIVDISYRASKVDNPTLPVSDRKSNSIELTEFPNQVMVRLGVGLSF